MAHEHIARLNERAERVAKAAVAALSPENVEAAEKLVALYKAAGKSETEIVGALTDFFPAPAPTEHPLGDMLLAAGMGAMTRDTSVGVVLSDDERRVAKSGTTPLAKAIGAALESPGRKVYLTSEEDVFDPEALRQAGL